MSRIRNAEPRTNDLYLERLKRKRDQEWDMAGLARADGDHKAEVQHTAQAKEYGRLIAEYLS